MGGQVATFVLVHGGRHGGWSWKQVASNLRARGHEVYAPSLSGLGDRAHLLDLVGVIDLDTHIQEITALVVFEDLTDVILVGHSYGGMVITAVADRDDGRVSRVVFLDAQVPRNGESVLDLMSDEGAEAFRQMIAEGGGLRVPARLVTPEFWDVTDPSVIEWMRPRITDQPAATLEQKIRLSSTPLRVPRTYIKCTASDKMPLTLVERVLEDPEFELISLPIGHDAGMIDPGLVAGLLDEISARRLCMARGQRKSHINKANEEF
jgi:pimeloyl-ACP methyl ester carboxylesterase